MSAVISSTGAVGTSEPLLQLRGCPPVYSFHTGNAGELPCSCAAQAPQPVSMGNNSSCHWLSQCFRSANYLFLVMTNKSKWRTVLEGGYFKIHWLGTRVGTALPAAVWITVILSKKYSVFRESWWREGLASLYFILMTAEWETILFSEKTSLPSYFSSQTNRDLIVAIQPRTRRLPRAATLQQWLPLIELYCRHIWQLCSEHV